MTVATGGGWGNVTEDARRTGLGGEDSGRWSVDSGPLGTAGDYVRTPGLELSVKTASPSSLRGATLLARRLSNHAGQIPLESCTHIIIVDLIVDTVAEWASGRRTDFDDHMQSG